jgi:hypothetical protein
MTSHGTSVRIVVLPSPCLHSWTPIYAAIWVVDVAVSTHPTQVHLDAGLCSASPTRSPPPKKREEAAKGGEERSVVSISQQKGTRRMCFFDRFGSVMIVIMRGGCGVGVGSVWLIYTLLQMARLLDGVNENFGKGKLNWILEIFVCCGFSEVSCMNNLICTISSPEKVAFVVSISPVFSGDLRSVGK